VSAQYGRGKGWIKAAAVADDMLADIQDLVKFERDHVQQDYCSCKPEPAEALNQATRLRLLAERYEAHCRAWDGGAPMFE